MNELNFLDEGSTISSPSSQSISLVDEPYTLISTLESDASWNELNSIVPLLEQLPALKKVNGYYVLNGEVKAEDIEHIKTYASKVKKFTSITGSPDVDSPIAPSAYFQLFQLLGAPLSSIRELRLSSSAPVLPYVSILLSSLLCSVEMDIVSSDNSQDIEPFLNSLPFKSPSLQRLVFRGPDKLPNSSLEFVSQCLNLRSLELSNVVIITDWNLLQSISTLPSLEELVVITHNLEYKNEADVLDASGFRSLQKLTITAPFLLIRDLVGCIGSSVQSIAMTPLIDLATLFTPPRILPATPEPLSIAALPFTSGPNPSRSGDRNEATSHTFKKKKKGVVSSQVKENSTPQVHVAPPATISAPVEDFNPKEWLTLLQQTFDIATLRWGDSLQSLTLGLQDTSKPALIPNASNVLELPLDLVLFWRRFRQLQALDIRFWKIASLDDALKLLSTGSWPQLQTLRLPLEPYGNPIHLSTLHPLISHRPNLNMIQASINCKVDTIGESTLEALPDFKYTSKHKLTTLSLGSIAAPKQPLMIAKYINILFPHLDTPETHEGLNEEHWKHVFDVARLCQSVREDDRKRFSK